MNEHCPFMGLECTKEKCALFVKDLKSGIFDCSFKVIAISLNHFRYNGLTIIK